MVAFPTSILTTFRPLALTLPLPFERWQRLTQPPGEMVLYKILVWNMWGYCSICLSGAAILMYTPRKKTNVPYKGASSKGKACLPTTIFHGTQQFLRGVSLEIVFKMVHPLLWPKQMAPSFLVDVESLQISMHQAPNVPSKFSLKSLGLFHQFCWKKKMAPLQLFHPSCDTLFSFRSSWPGISKLRCLVQGILVTSQHVLLWTLACRRKNARKNVKNPGKETGCVYQKKVYLKSHVVLKNVA